MLRYKQRVTNQGNSLSYYSRSYGLRLLSLIAPAAEKGHYGNMSCQVISTSNSVSHKPCTDEAEVREKASNVYNRNKKHFHNNIIIIIQYLHIIVPDQFKIALGCFTNILKNKYVKNT